MAKARSRNSTKARKSIKINPATATIIVALITAVGGIIMTWIQNAPPPTPTPLIIPSTSPSPTITLFVPSVTSSPTNTPVAPTLAQALPTSTFLPRALIDRFDVVDNGTTIATLKPEETTSVKAGSIVKIKVLVSTDIPLTDLFFSWSICTQPGKFTEGKMVTEILYQAPNTPVIDCVGVMIKKEGIIITNTTRISLNVN